MTETAKVEAAPQRSLVKKLAEIMGEVERVPKSGRNEFHKYDYATEADIASAVRAGMAKRLVMLIPTVEKTEWRDIPTKSGTQKLCTLTVKFTLHDGDSGETLSYVLLGEGQDGGDKATYKALTGAEKYALLKIFLIPTGDDPERETPAQQPAPAVAGSRTADVKAKLAARVAKVPEMPEDPDPPSQAFDNETGEVPGEPVGQPMTFGSGKGKPLAELSAKDLAWYEKVLSENVGNPEKARFRQSNQAALDAIVREMEFRA